ncbi:helix-turn-helix domain-containing protein [Desulfotalea psychrophila]|uniref:helix-turn-helix domain-containing protein n=1 Tax=Desulfotalea psychrophila TaxID=84980 RepID=UPI00031C7064|nr:helix-turn-helix domain-containing protein [Desulfotalea psychrophila]
MAPIQELLTIDEVSNILKISAGTLRNWRSLGHGPSYIKVGGAVRYEKTAIIQFTQSNIF